MSVFSVTQKDQLVLVKCPVEMNSIAAQELADLVPQWAAARMKCFVFDFEGVTMISPVIFKTIALVQRNQKRVEGFLFSINLGRDLSRQIQVNGMESVFNPKASLSMALAAAGIQASSVAAKPTINVQFINPFIGATVNTLEMQASTKLTAGKPRLKKDGEKFDIEIAGVINLASSAFTGSIALCFPAKVFLGIYSNMLGETYTEITREIEDGAGELLNIIFGQAKALLNDKKGFEIQKAIPTIVRGAQLNVSHGRTLAVILPFETEMGPFHLEIAIEA